jgi:hypothetical protein
LEALMVDCPIPAASAPARADAKLPLEATIWPRRHATAVADRAVQPAHSLQFFGILEVIVRWRDPRAFTFEITRRR